MPHATVTQARDHTNETRRLATLLEISQALSGVLNLKAALHSVLDILERRHQVAGGAVMLVERDSRDAPRSGRRRQAPGRTRTQSQRRQRRHRARPRFRQGRGGAARQPGAEPRAAADRARAQRPARAVVHRGADHPRPPPDRHDGGRPPLQVGSRLSAVARVLQGRGFDDRAGDQGQPHGRGRPAQAGRRRTSTCATSCASAMRSATSSATARRSSRSTSRWRRWRAPTRRCSSAASREPARR